MRETLFERMDREIWESFEDRSPKYVPNADGRPSWFVERLDGDWIAVAARLPGKAAQVALAVWHCCHVEKSIAIRLTGKKAAKFGVSPKSKAASLRRLAAAGLVEVEFSDRRSPRVTLCGLSSVRWKTRR